nr:MAG TPA: hypothetical protein [Caudoviricetes sp.]
MPRVAKRSEGTDNAPHRGRCGGVDAPGRRSTWKNG